MLGELGVILLLLDVGLELSLGDLAAVGRSSLRVAAVGVVVPVLAGFGVALAFGESDNTALFVGAALAATSVGITARVFSDLGALTRVEARTVLGAAVADDVMGLVLLTIVVRLVTADSISALELGGIIGVALVFLVLAVVLGTRYGPRLLEGVDRHARSPGTFVAVALAFTLAFAALADAAELAPIVGAFAAGVALSGSGPAERVRRELKPVGHLFIPVFFLQIGVDADLDVFTKPDLLALVGCLLVVAIVGKVLAGTATLGAPGDKLLVGLGMLPRGEVGLIFASIGLAQGVLDADLYGAVVAVVLGTTLLAPPLLRWRIAGLQRRHRQRPTTPAPPGGWLRVTDAVDLVAEPPDEEVLVVALEAALLVTHARPSSELLDWLGRADATAARLGRAGHGATPRRSCGTGSVRSWRFLEATGILERALPELAAAVRSRSVDPFLLDPANVLQFDLVESVRNAVHHDPRAAAAFERLRHPERPLLAALVIAAVDGAGDPVELARRLSDRLRLGAVAEGELTALVADRSLLRAAGNPHRRARRGARAPARFSPRNPRTGTGALRAVARARRPRASWSATRSTSSWPGSCACRPRPSSPGRARSHSSSVSAAGGDRAGRRCDGRPRIGFAPHRGRTCSRRRHRMSPGMPRSSSPCRDGARLASSVTASSDGRGRIEVAAQRPARLDRGGDRACSPSVASTWCRRRWRRGPTARPSNRSRSV